MELQERIKAFTRFGSVLLEELNENKSAANSLQSAILKAQAQNQWFTPDSIRFSLHNIAGLLSAAELNKWLISYESSIIKNKSPKKIGVIMAGNIPLVGFHDVLCVLLSGHHLMAKLSKDDAVLIPFLLNRLVETEPAFGASINYVDRLEKPDAVIATGSNNSARYFEYYFGKYPHIIRKNRNSAAIITGDENADALKKVGTDIFTYFGLGCRNVSKLYVPEAYDFDLFFQTIESFSAVMDHNKYMNNYDYNHAVYLLNGEKFLTNNFLIVRANEALATPVSVLNYEYYNNLNELEKKLRLAEQSLQCISVAGQPWQSFSIKTIPFGTSQSPGLNNYADNIDTLQFLLSV